MLNLKRIILSKPYGYYTSMVMCVVMKMLSLEGIIIHSKSYWCCTSMVVCVYYVLPISNYKVCYRNKNHHNYNMLFPMFEQRQDSRVQNMIAKLPSCQVRDFMMFPHFGPVSIRPIPGPQEDGKLLREDGKKMRRLW